MADNDRGGGERQRATDDERTRPVDPEPPGNKGPRDGAHRHLGSAKAEQHTLHRPELGEGELQANSKEQKGNADLAQEMGDFARLDEA